MDRAQAFYIDPRLIDKSAPRVNRYKHFNDRQTSDIIVACLDNTFYLHRKILWTVEGFATMLMAGNVARLDIRIESRYLEPALKYIYGIALPMMSLRELIDLFRATDFLLSNEDYTLYLLGRINKLRAVSQQPELLVEALTLCAEVDNKFIVYDTDICYNVIELMPFSLFIRILPRVPRNFKYAATLLWVLAHHEDKVYHRDDTATLLEMCPLPEAADLLRYYETFMSYNTIPELSNYITNAIAQIKLYYPTAGNIASYEASDLYPPTLYDIKGDVNTARSRTPFSRHPSPIIADKAEKSDDVGNMMKDLKRMRL